MFGRHKLKLIMKDHVTRLINTGMIEITSRCTKAKILGHKFCSDRSVEYSMATNYKNDTNIYSELKNYDRYESWQSNVRRKRLEDVNKNVINVISSRFPR